MTYDASIRLDVLLDSAAAHAVPVVCGVATGLMDMPARTVGSMVLLDLTVHAWDVARATGAPFEPAPAVVAELAEVCAEMASMGRRMNVFAEAVVPPKGASAFEHLLAATGRDPRT
ncbi:hypothetical protein ACFY8X_31230 [Streptomyces tanashiensis]|uniref:hypothetical protein n=1 Tax=Streptomyces tanashiensis TaxID=67367 RepID=UPI0036EE2BA9